MDSLVYVRVREAYIHAENYGVRSLFACSAHKKKKSLFSTFTKKQKRDSFLDLLSILSNFLWRDTTFWKVSIFLNEVFKWHTKYVFPLHIVTQWSAVFIYMSFYQVIYFTLLLLLLNFYVFIFIFIAGGGGGGGLMQPPFHQACNTHSLRGHNNTGCIIVDQTNHRMCFIECRI